MSYIMNRNVINDFFKEKNEDEFLSNIEPVDVTIIGYGSLDTEFAEKLVQFLDEWHIPKRYALGNCFVAQSDELRPKLMHLGEVLYYFDWFYRVEEKIDRERRYSADWPTRLDSKLKAWGTRREMMYCKEGYQAATEGRLDYSFPDYTEHYLNKDGDKVYAFTEILIGVGIAQMFRKLEIESEILQKWERSNLENKILHDQNPAHQVAEEEWQTEITQLARKTKLPIFDWTDDEVLIPLLIHLLVSEGFMNMERHFAFISKYFTANKKPIDRVSLKNNFHQAGYLHLPGDLKPEKVKKLEAIRDILVQASEYFKIAEETLPF